MNWEEGCIGWKGLVMVDDPNYNYPALNFGIPLMKQRFSRLFTRRMAVMEKR